MNGSELDKMLHRVAADTFEALALMFLVPEEEACFDLGGIQTGRVAFSGPFAGELVVRVSAGVLPELTANMLGADEDSAPSTEQQEDALKELTNVICGNLLPVLAEPHAIFHVDAPVFLSADVPDDEIGTGTQMAAARVFVDAGMADVSLFVSKPAALETVG